MRPLHFVAVVLFVAANMWSAFLYADVLDDIKISASHISERAVDIRGRYLGKSGFKGKHYVEERLIDGENYYRLKDYQRASIIFMDIIESYPEHSAYPDALFYYADSLFLSRDYYGARNWFNKFLDDDSRTSRSRFRNRVISRLVEVAIHLNDFDDVERYFQMLNKNLDADAYYVKGKFLYFKGDVEGAREAFNLVAGNTELELKARYFAGVTFIKQNRYDDALELFKNSVARYKNVTNEQQEIVDLLNLGIGRLYYEKDFVENAAAAYQEISRYSKYYDVALYEAAAVHMLAGNTILAERILEVLTLAIPDSQYIPKAKLLRGNLLLRAGRYADAEKVFNQTIEQFVPVKDKITTMLGDTEDAESFFNALIERNLDSLDISGLIPEDVVKWVGEEPEVKRAFGVAQDLGIAQEYTDESIQLLQLIEAVVNGSSPVHAVPTLRAAKRQALELRNQLIALYGNLMSEVKKHSRKDDVQIISPLVSRYTRIRPQIESLPTDDAEFKKQEAKAKGVYVSMRKELARQNILLDRMDAMLVGLVRYVDKPEYTEALSKDILKSYLMEMDRTKAGVRAKRDEIEMLIQDIEKAKVQIGFGFLEKDENDIIEKTEVLSDEFALYAQSNMGSWGQKVDDSKRQISQALKIVTALCTSIDVDAATQVAVMKEQLAKERNNLAEYKIELIALNEDAKDVVSGVARENFSGIRKRFYDLILKADIGIIDIAWLIKEEHKTRGIHLNKERTTEIQNLNDEFNDVNNPSQGTDSGN